MTTSNKPKCPNCGGLLFSVLLIDDESGRSHCYGCHREGDASPVVAAILEAFGVSAPHPREWPKFGPIKQTGRYLVRDQDGSSIGEMNLQEEDWDNPPSRKPEWDSYRLFGPI